MIILLGLDTIRGVINSEYSAYYSKSEKDIVFVSYRNIFNLLLIISILILFITLVYREQIISILLPGFSDERYYKSIEISLVIFPIIFFRTFMGFFQSIFNAFHRFYTPIILPMIGTIIVLVSIFLPYYKNDLIYNLSYSNLFGNILIALFLFLGIYKMGGKPNLMHLKIDVLTKKIIKNCLSIFILVVCNQLFFISKNYFASYFGKGAISALSYSSYIPLTISTLIFSIIFSVLLANLSNTFASKRKSIARKLFINTFLGLFFILVPICIIFILFRYEVLKLVFLRGNFDLDGLNKVVIPFLWESLSMISFVIFIIPTALFLAKKEYFLMTKIGSIVYLFGILLNYLLVTYIDFYGVAISHFFITILYGFLLLFYSRKFLGRYRIYSLHFILIVISGMITFIVLYIIKNYIIHIIILDTFFENICFVIIGSIIILIFYLIITTLFKINYLFRIKELYFKKDNE
jgi:putative peptidoglycan lipid II flippase